MSELIRRRLDAGEPRLERVVFGGEDPGRVAAMIDRFCSERLGSPVLAAIFYRSGVGAVIGVRLADARTVVIKVHRHNVSLTRLEAVQQVQANLAEAGLPAPRPLLPPAPLGSGIATVEEYIPRQSADGHDPVVRQNLAQMLCQLVRAAEAFASAPQVGPAFIMPSGHGRLWPEPHELRFDFDASGDGAGWIDELWVVARRRLAAASAPPVIGHFDWRIENLSYAHGRVAGIYDWDSLAAAPEAVMVGCNAAHFTADYATGEVDPLPRPDEMLAFVLDYEAARQAPFTAPEWDLIDAANLALLAYGARCEHSDAVLGLFPNHDNNGFRRLLSERRPLRL